MRECWDAEKYMTGGPTSTGRKAFIPEESSKVTLRLVSELMKCDYQWACIALVAELANEAEVVGNWSERCPCIQHQYSSREHKIPGKRRKVVALPTEAVNCPYRACRAPELACGVAMSLQACRMMQYRSVFNQYVSRAPQAKQAELHSTWSKSTSRIWGALASSASCWKSLSPRIMRLL